MTPTKQPPGLPARFRLDLAMPVIVAIEGGGTKFVCAASLDGTSLLERKVVPTRSPQETLPDLLEYVDRAALTYGRISAISLAVFGPIETDPNRSAYGRVGSTSKQGWTGFDYLEAFEKYNVTGSSAPRI